MSELLWFKFDMIDGQFTSPTVLIPILPDITIDSSLVESHKQASDKVSMWA
jgi:hypothetical protein